MSDITSTETGIVFTGDIEPTCLNFGPVKVYPDGRIERTEKFTTDEEAAKSFWMAVEMFMPLDSKTKSPTDRASS
jgi:hypothetical protein